MNTFGMVVFYPVTKVFLINFYSILLFYCINLRIVESYQPKQLIKNWFTTEFEYEVLAKGTKHLTTDFDV